MFERILKYFQQIPITESRGYKMQHFISFLMVQILFEKKLYWGVETLTITNFEHFSLDGVDTLIIKILKQKFFGRVIGYTQSSGPGELTRI